MKQNHWLIIGILLVLFILYCLKARASKPKVFYKNKLVGGFNAITIPPIGIFISNDQKNNDQLLAHELIHWEQYQKEGLLPYLFNYATEAMAHGYDQNAYEVAARTNESDYCKANYTECVRSGAARTVHNPSFLN